MSRIAKLKNEYYMNFDDHCLCFGNEQLIELKGRPLEVLEYLCNHPNCYKRIEDINHYLDEGCLSNSTIRGYIYDLLVSHPVFKDVIINTRGAGYKYIGGKIYCEAEEHTSRQLEDNYIERLIDFIDVADSYESDFLKSILFCSCKWGACSYDDIPQNTNTCEGIMAIMLSHKAEIYADVIDDRITYLTKEMKDAGLRSKSLDIETVVPTAMYLYICKKYGNDDLIEKAERIANILWSAKCDSGWGLYVKDMNGYTNIGCTYWAIRGLAEYGNILQDDFQLYLRSLFKYDNTYSFGQTIDDANPRIPCLYSSSMMYIMYMMLTEEGKMIVGKRYDKRKAIDYIIQNFDNPFFIVEQEGINGVEIEGKISVHTVNWNHITIHYSLLAISLAIEEEELTMDVIQNIASRTKNIILQNSERSDGRVYWSGPKMQLEKGRRGKLVFPTMHFLMGLSSFRNSVEHTISKCTSRVKK